MAMMLVDELSLARMPLTVHQYRLQLRMGEHIFLRQTDDNLGHLMSVCSDLWKSIALRAGMQPPDVVTPLLRSPIRLSELWIGPSLVVGERWTLRLTSGPYRYVAGMTDTLESVILAFMGAMKFFGLKYGYTTLDAEVTRNREQAVAAGMATKEDHVKRAKPGRSDHA